MATDVYFTEEVRAAAGHVASTLATGGPPELREIYGRCATRGDLQVDALLEQFAVMGGGRDDMDFDAADLASIPVPTLIVHGDRDEFFPVDIPVGMYRAMPDASLWIVPGGDHVALFGPEGSRIIEGAVRFLRETSGSAAGSVPGIPSTPPRGTPDRPGTAPPPLFREPAHTR